MINANKVLGNILGKPVGDKVSLNKQKGYCDFCGSKTLKPGDLVGHDGEMAFMCNDCIRHKQQTPDWDL